MNAQTAAPRGEARSRLDGLRAALRGNVREYAMYIALVVIFVVSGVATKGLFLSPRNLTDLIKQTGYVAVLAIGMTVVLIIRHIDLSVGYVAGFMGAMSAKLLTNGFPIYAVIPIVLAIGAAIGAYQGFLVSRVHVPAFVTTLAGMFIFRGLLSLVTAGTGTIIVRDEAFRALSNGFIPQIFEGSRHWLTFIIGLACAAVLAAVKIRARRNESRAGSSVSPALLFIFQMALFTSVILTAAWILSGYRGLPWTAAIVAAVLLSVNFVLTQTRFGRSVYAIGGNPEAAELSGIDVAKVTFIVFCGMSMFASLAGVLYTSRLSSATPTAGLGFEMDAIASSYIGGVAVSGGVGKVTNTLVGALVIMSLTNSMNLLGVDISYQYVVKGVIFIVAVAFDILSRRRA
ncbi:MAG: sugar ABC transporter permease [Oscillospiraceae bacterium]|jgi:putative multiple sugar transport system permease protein|nr:sugar ABC transporter permease [Oscillospiraceae bacterium]